MTPPLEAFCPSLLTAEEEDTAETASLESEAVPPVDQALLCVGVSDMAGRADLDIRVAVGGRLVIPGIIEIIRISGIIGTIGLSGIIRGIGVFGHSALAAGAACAAVCIAGALVGIDRYAVRGTA